MSKILAVTASLVLLSVPLGARCGCDTTCGLSDYNRDLLLEYLSNNKSELLASATVKDFFTLTPGGIASPGDAADFAGWPAVTSAEVYTHRIEVFGDTAVLGGKISAAGGPDGKPAPDLGFLSVFRMADGEWLLVAQSLVPFHPGVEP
jgi:hypothetical protein